MADCVDMDLLNYVDNYDKLVMNFIIAQDTDIEYYDEINEFIEKCDYIAEDNLIPTTDRARHRKALIKFFKEFCIGYNGNIFLEKSGTEIWIKLQELYQEVLNEED